MTSIKKITKMVEKHKLQRFQFKKNLKYIAILPPNVGKKMKMVPSTKVIAYTYLDKSLRFPIKNFKLQLPYRFFAKSKKNFLFTWKPHKDLFENDTKIPKNCYLTKRKGEKSSKKVHQPDILFSKEEQIKWLYNKLEDKLSKETLISLIKHRITGNVDYLKIANYSEYEHPITKAQPGDHIIDGGSWVGDSLFKFTKFMKGKGQIYAFEPDKNSITELQKNALKSPIKTKVFNLGIWDKSDTLYFNVSEFGASSNIIDNDSSEDTVRIPVSSLDELYNEEKIEKVDLIKFDLEGAEEEALNGSVNVIKRFKPRLMISIYHKKDDLLSLPKLVDEIQPGYKFYLGHHNYYHTETDLYCIHESEVNTKN